MIRATTLTKSGLRAAVGHIAGQDRGDKTVYFEGITLKPEPSIGVDRGGRVVLWGRGCPEELRGRAVNVRTATGLMLGDQIGGAEVKKRRGHIEGYGLVWGASKSVSLLLAVLSDAEREELLKKFEGAVQKAITDAEEWLWVRRGAGGREVERVAGGLCAYAIHATSGRGDPHLHVHVLLRAVGRCEDGEWRTIDSESVLEMAKKILDARIARYLREALREMGIAARERVVGSVPTLEVPALETMAARFSSRSLDMAIAEGEAKGWRNHLRAWYESRRGLSAEALEHAMDAEVLANTGIGQAIIAAWRQRAVDRDPTARDRDPGESGDSNRITIPGVDPLARIVDRDPTARDHDPRESGDSDRITIPGVDDPLARIREQIRPPKPPKKRIRGRRLRRLPRLPIERRKRRR